MLECLLYPSLNNGSSLTPPPKKKKKKKEDEKLGGIFNAVRDGGSADLSDKLGL